MTTAIKERPIDMRDWEVRALREGRRTQTRRAMKTQPPDGATEVFVEYPHGKPMATYRAFPGKGTARWGVEECPYGSPGDRLYVRETWSPDHAAFYPHFPVVYRVEGIPGEWEIVAGKVHSPEGGEDFPFKWRSSTQMPRHYSRNVIEVVSVRIERVQSITEADAIAEGMTARLLGQSVARLAARIRPEPPRWLYGVDDYGHVYCHKCGRKRVRKESKSHPGREVFLDGGWIGEEDHQPFCETCGVALDFSLTDYGVDEMLSRFGEEMTPITLPSRAHAVHAMLGWHGNPILTETCGDFAYKPEVAGTVARICFRHLWDQCYAKKGLGWETNPWTWVIEHREARC